MGGLKTFRDTSTGRVWLDMNNFFDVTSSVSVTGVQMISTAHGAGFTFANQGDVTARFAATWRRPMARVCSRDGLQRATATDLGYV